MNIIWFEQFSELISKSPEIVQILLQFEVCFFFQVFIRIWNFLEYSTTASSCICEHTWAECLDYGCGRKELRNELTFCLGMWVHAGRSAHTDCRAAGDDIVTTLSFVSSLWITCLSCSCIFAGCMIVFLWLEAALFLYFTVTHKCLRQLLSN